MKTALVIGLALTANAYKTEQTETSVHIKGNVKDWKDLQNLIPHGLKFDDQADDELHIAPRDKDGHRLPYKPGVKYDDELLIRAPQAFADDELVWYEKTRSGLPKIHFGERPKEDLKFHVGEGFKRSGEKTRSGLPKFHFDEETDNEYVSLPKDYIEILKSHKFLLEIHDQRADDEFATLPYKDYTNILKNFPKGFIGQEIKQADDEFMTLFYHQAPNRFRIPKGGSSRPSNQGPSKQELPSGEFPKMILGSDNPGLYFGDDELMSRPILQQVVNDDELAFWHAPPKEFASHPALDKLAVAIRVDDEVDDELVLLKDLLKPERYRPVDGALPRDELRVAENPKLRGGLERKHHNIIIP